jgi:hypothetical protein
MVMLRTVHFMVNTVQLQSAQMKLSGQNKTLEKFVEES